MKVRLIQTVDGSLIKSEFDIANIYECMEVRGYAFTHLSTNTRVRAELQNQPQFSGLCGPMWDGDAIRYEDQAANDTLSM